MSIEQLLLSAMQARNTPKATSSQKPSLPKLIQDLEWQIAIEMVAIQNDIDHGRRCTQRIEKLFDMNGMLAELQDEMDVEFNDVIKQSHISNFKQMHESDKSTFNWLSEKERKILQKKSE